MLASFVVRLVPEALATGRVVGEVEAVTTGARVQVRTLDELLAFFRRANDASAGGAPVG